MAITANLDYAVTYFEFPVLDKIHGEPNYESLKKLKKQLKANAQSVPSTLGGGNHGLLGLVLTQAEYARVSNDQFNIPLRPGALLIPPFTANHETIRLQGEHEQAKETFNDCMAVKKTLIKQIVAAVDAEYLKELRDPDTNSINMDIPDILDHLFVRYGFVTPEALATEEASMATFYWDLRDPPVIMFNKIEDLIGLSAAAGMPKTEAQIINYGLGIIKRTNDFEQALLNWYNLPAGNQTYANFKQHFADAQRELKKIRGARLRDTKFQQANQVADLRADFDRFRDEVVTSVNALAAVQDQNQQTQEEQEPPKEQANATTDVNAAILLLLQQMRNDMAKGATIIKEKQNERRRYTGRRTTNKYCWSHGACAHDSADCKSPKPGHKKEATFENKMGGDESYCKK